MANKLDYEIKLTIGDNSYTTKGATLLDGLKKLKKKIEKDPMKMFGVFTVSYKEQFSEIPVRFYPLQLKKAFFVSDTNLELMANRIETLR